MDFKVKDLMMSPIVTTLKTSTIDYVRELMERKNIQAVPVVESKDHLEVIGIITSSDLRGITEGTAKVADYMTNDIYWVKSEVDAEIAARIMLEEMVHHLLVKDDEKVLGMLSSLDFVRLVAEKDFMMV